MSLMKIKENIEYKIKTKYMRIVMAEHGGRSSIYSIDFNLNFINKYLNMNINWQETKNNLYFYICATPPKVVKNIFYSLVTDLTKEYDNLIQNSIISNYYNLSPIQTKNFDISKTGRYAAQIICISISKNENLFCLSWFYETKSIPFSLFDAAPVKILYFEYMRFF